MTSDIGYQLIGDSANLLQSDRSEEECKYVLMTSDYEHDEHDDDYEQSYAIRTNLSSVHTRHVFDCNCMFCFVRTEVNLAQTLSVPLRSADIKLAWSRSFGYKPTRLPPDTTSDITTALHTATGGEGHQVHR